MDEHDGPYEDEESSDTTLEAPVVRRERLPWVLFFVTIAIFLGVTVLLVGRVNAADQKVMDAAAAREKAEAKAKQVDASLTTWMQKVEHLESDVKAIKAERDGYEKQLKAAEAKLEEAKKAPAAPVKKGKAAPPAKKKKK